MNALQAASPMTTVTFATATRRGMVPVQSASDQPASSVGWPLYATLELGALLTAPGCGRAWTAALLREWRLIRLADTAQVVVSELLTNAVRASTGLDQSVVQLSLACDWHQLLILVRDYDPGAPYPRHADAEDEGGRGLMLVETVARDSAGSGPLTEPRESSCGRSYELRLRRQECREQPDRNRACLPLADRHYKPVHGASRAVAMPVPPG
jgi:hypothetical protein